MSQQSVSVGAPIIPDERILDPAFADGLEWLLEEVDQSLDFITKRIEKDEEEQRAEKAERRRKLLQKRQETRTATKQNEEKTESQKDQIVSNEYPVANKTAEDTLDATTVVELPDIPSTPH